MLANLKLGGSEPRYERKFVAPASDLQQVRGIIKFHPARFREAFSPRCVNNIYLDSPDRECLTANDLGMTPRAKVRVRWYGTPDAAIDQPRLEIKIKHGYVGEKLTYDLPPLPVSLLGEHRELMGRLRTARLPPYIREIVLSSEPSLGNRYAREYFVTHDGRFRLTIDTNIQYFKPLDLLSVAQCNKTFIDAVVLELKYALELDGDADLLTGYFHHRWGKNSKYLQGMEYLAT